MWVALLLSTSSDGKHWVETVASSTRSRIRGINPINFHVKSGRRHKPRRDRSFKVRNNPSPERSKSLLTEMVFPIEGEPSPSTGTTSALSITKMPNEILARVFSAGTKLWQELDPSRLPFPILVSSVCHGWRVVAHSTPELWAFIIPPLHLFDTADDGQRWTSEWIARSGGLLVSIVIDDRLPSERIRSVQHSQAIILGTLRGIGLHSHRLRRLDIWSPHVFPTDLNSVFQNTAESVQLRQLSLCCGRITQTQILPHSSPQTSNLFSWFGRLPRLHKLRLAGAIFPVVSSLTTLAVHGLCAQYSEAQNIFATCPNITTLVLPQLLPIAFPPSPPASLPIIPVPSLKSIAVKFKRFPHAESNLPYLVGILHMPNLEYLEVEGEAEMSSIFDGSLPPDKIQTLRLTYRPRVHRADQVLLQSLNNLRRLELKEIPVELLLSDMTASPPVGRKRSIGSIFTRPPSSSVSTLGGASSSRWPLLTEITLDSIFPEDVMHLCRFVNLNRGVKTVRLSKHAKRHLSGSLLRHGDIVSVKEARWKRKGSAESGVDDVEDWLGKLVEVKVFKSSPGMIDREAFPLQAL